VPKSGNSGYDDDCDDGDGDGGSGGGSDDRQLLSVVRRHEQRLLNHRYFQKSPKPLNHVSFLV